MKNQKMIKKLLMVAVLGSHLFNVSSLFGMEERNKIGQRQQDVVLQPNPLYKLTKKREQEKSNPAFIRVEVRPEQTEMAATSPVSNQDTNLASLPDEIIGSIISNMSKLEDINNLLKTTHRFGAKEKRDFLRKWVINLDLSLKDNLSDDDLGKIVTQFPNLLGLNLRWTNITNRGLTYLQRLPRLQYLNLSKCEKITDAGLADIAKLSNLQSLNLTECRQITDIGLDNLTNPAENQCLLGNLRELNLYSCNAISDRGVINLARLAEIQNRLTGSVKLQKLIFFGCSGHRGITGESLAHLAKIVSLKELGLDDCNIKDKDLAKLANLTNLKKLDLWGISHITKAGIKLYLGDLIVNGLEVTFGGGLSLEDTTVINSSNIDL